MGTEIDDTDAFIESLIALPRETDWAEFKMNTFHAENVGKYVSSIANSAMLAERDEGYLVFGIEDVTHEVLGTSVNIAAEKIGNVPYLLWLSQQLDPHMYVHHQRIIYGGKRVEVICVKPTYHQPVRFKGRAYVRVASAQQDLNNHTNLERSLWQITNRYAFESALSERNVTWDQVEAAYDYSRLLRQMGKNFETGGAAVEHLANLGLLHPNLQKRFDVSTLMGLTCAKNMNQISLLKNKTVRVVEYAKHHKMDAVSDTEGARGYTITFEDLMKFLMQRIPSQEIMLHGIRRREFQIPEAAIREILANAIVHQDFTVTGERPTVELFSDKIRVTNPGEPLVEPDRFIDTPSKSRNPLFAALMRAAGICEQRGSGVDRAIREIEEKRLPPPLIQTVQGSTVVTIFTHKPFSQLGPDDRIRACYQHACIRFEENEPMSNQTLRRRFGLADKQYPQVSDVIADAIRAGRIKPLNEGQANKIARYVPYWA